MLVAPLLLFYPIPLHQQPLQLDPPSLCDRWVWMDSRHMFIQGFIEHPEHPYRYRLIPDDRFHGALNAEDRPALHDCLVGGTGAPGGMGAPLPVPECRFHSSTRQERLTCRICSISL